MPRRKSKPIDRTIGANIRRHRVERCLTQAELAAKLGVTFQQVQKYEKGLNRIPAGQLYHTARALKLPVGRFFEDIEMDGTRGVQPKLPSPATGLRHAVRLEREFWGVVDPKLRRCLVELVGLIGERELERRHLHRRLGRTRASK